MNGLPPLLELLGSEFPIIQQFALRTLESITTDRDICTAFREQQGFARLLEILTNKVSSISTPDIVHCSKHDERNNGVLFSVFKKRIAISSYCVSWDMLHHL